jgi:hypothetical protein
MPAKKLYFFKRKGILFIPIHFIGWAFLLFSALLLLYVLATVVMYWHSLNGDGVNYFLFSVIVLVGFLFFALFTCKPNKETFDR